MTMAISAREAACKAAWRKVPALRGVKPSQRKVGERSVFTFTKRVATAPGGPMLSHRVKVTVGANGRVEKVVVGR
jgi:hypothetical protein